MTTFLWKLSGIVLTINLLAACSPTSGETNSDSTSDLVPQGKQAIETHGAEETSTEQDEVGFEVAGGVIEEATNVPEEEKKQIIQAFQNYIGAFNEENIDAYMEQISENPQGFSYDSELQFVEETFAEYDTKRTASDVTIIKYNEDEAQVYSNLEIELEQQSTGGKVSSSGRQITVFSKENEQWLVTSVYFIRD